MTEKFTVCPGPWGEDYNEGDPPRPCWIGAHSWCRQIDFLPHLSDEEWRQVEMYYGERLQAQGSWPGHEESIEILRSINPKVTPLGTK